jgi:hypothetical protein
MSDPFLWAHELARHVFDISTDLKPGSIRDQVIRGTLLVHRAAELGIIGPDGRNLLVIGAGAAGVAAAVTAARMRIWTELIDKQDHAFNLQRGCGTRYIEPTVYDWPAAHWPFSKYPWLDRERPPLPLRRHRARQVVEGVWDPAFDAARTSLYPFLKVRWKTKTINFPPPQRNGRYRVQFDDGSSGTYNMVVLAKGFGVEYDRLQDGSPFRSYRFWDTDEVEALARSDHRILISGGGDGALQDFLRLVLKRSDRLPSVVGRIPAAQETLALCHSVSENRNACSVWCREDQHDHEIDRFMHDAYREHIDELWKIPAEQRAITKLMGEILRDPLPRVTMIHRCDHFSRSYPINRFLVLLIDKYVRETTHDVTRLIWQEHELETIECLHPAGAEPDKQHCLRQPHRVTYREQPCAIAPRSTRVGEPPPDREYAAILLRHGAKPRIEEAEGDAKPLARPLYKINRQVLPYHLGHMAR